MTIGIVVLCGLLICLVAYTHWRHEQERARLVDKIIAMGERPYAVSVSGEPKVKPVRYLDEEHGTTMSRGSVDNGAEA